MRVRIRGKVYESAEEAAKAHGVSEATIKSAINRGREDYIGVGSNKTPVTIRGKSYPTMVEASRALGISADSITHARQRGTLDNVGLGHRIWAKVMLEGFDKFLSGCGPVDLAKDLTVAGLFAGAARDACTDQDAGTVAMVRAFLTALHDPDAPELDRFRANAKPEPENREGYNLREEDLP